MIPQNQGRGPLDGQWSPEVRRDIARSYSIGESFGGFMVGCGFLFVLIVGLMLAAALSGLARVAGTIAVFAVALAIPTGYLLVGRRRPR